MTFGSICGEGNDVDMNAVSDWKTKIIELTSGYETKNIANCDETALFYRVPPNRSLQFRGEKCKGGKFSKERLTVFLCVFGDGRFEQPLVIGKSENPRCFKSINKDNLPVKWKSNKTAWMTGTIMKQWLLELNSKMNKEKRQILLFMDNATSHRQMELSNVKIIFLPPKTTSHLQPLDQGIIRSFKVLYRKRLLSQILSNMELYGTSNEIASSVNCLDAIYWINDSVKSVSISCVINCFRAAGFDFEKFGQEELINTAEVVEMLALLQPDLNAIEYIHIDDDVHTEDDLIEVTSNDDVEESDEEENGDEDEPCKISTKECLLNLIKLKNHFIAEGKPEISTSLLHMIHEVQLDFASQKVQKKICDYFLPINTM